MTTTDRRKREIQRTREDILEAAARAFARSGYARVTMQEIAHEAGYTAASLYTYFRSKDEIVQGLKVALTAEYAKTFDEKLPDGLTFAQKFQALLLRQLEAVDRHRTVFTSLFAAGETCGQSFHDNFEERIGHAAQWMRNNAKACDLGGRDPETAARFLFGFVFAFIHHGIAIGAKERLVTLAPLFTDLFFNGIGKRTS
jgi:AcrR family transcriptional regulator